MAFIGKNDGMGYQPGWFLVNNEDCTRVTKNFKHGDSTHITIKTDKNGHEYVPMGSVYKVESDPVGIVYEDVDLTYGEAAGSVVTEGVVYKDRLITEAQSDAESITTITLIDNAPTVERPKFNGEE